MKILVVDDSKSIRDLIEDILTAHNYEVETAENGAQAIDKYAKFKPDLVTLDLAMPVMDGYDTFNKLLMLDKNVQVIMISASEQVEALERCLQKGVIGYVVKPFTEKELISSILNAQRAGSDRIIVALFSRASSKIQESVRKMTDSNAEVIINSITVIRQVVVPLPSSSFELGKIRVISQFTDELKIDPPSNAIGYLTEVSGQQHGVLVSFISKSDLKDFFEINDIDKQYNTKDSPMEFFNIINQKILSEIANYTHLMLRFEPIRLYNKDDHDLFHGHTVTKTIFEITHRKKRTLVEVYLWFEMDQLQSGFKVH